MLFRSVRVLEFPPPLADDKAALGLRLKTLAVLRAWSLKPFPCVVVAAFPALTAPVPSPSGAAGIRLAPGDDSAPGLSALASRLAAMGYVRAPMVEREGEFSVRGGILDVWSPGDEFPVRAEFFGDAMESLRAFSAATQQSIERLDACEVLPASEEGGEEGGAAARKLTDELPHGSALLALEHAEYDIEVPAAATLAVFAGDPAPRGVPTYAFQTSPLPGFAEFGADEARHPELFDAARDRKSTHLNSSHTDSSRMPSSA